MALAGMLNISPAQLDTLAIPFDAEFLARARSFLQAQAPQLVENAGDQFELQLAAALRDARALGVLSEREQVLHVILSLIHGLGFAGRETWAIEIVQSRRAAAYASGLPQALMEAAHGVVGRQG